MARADFFEQPTDEHFVAPEFYPYGEPAPNLTAGVFTSEQLEIVLDPDYGEVAKFEAIGQAMLHENPDLWHFMQKDEYGVDPNDPLADQDMWFRAATDYAERQASVQEILLDEDLVKHISQHDFELLSVATIEEKQAFLGLITEEYLGQNPQSKPAQLPEPNTPPEITEEILEQEKIAANKLLNLLDGNDSFNIYLLGRDEPVDVNKLIQDDVPTTQILSKLEALHDDFQLFVDQPTEQYSLPGIQPDETGGNKTLRDQAKLVRGAIAQRLQKITEDIEQLPARQKLTAAALTGVMAAATLGGGSKDDITLFPGHQNKTAITMVNPKSVRVDMPSEVAFGHLKIKSNRRIPEDKRNLIISTAGEDYAKAVISQFNEQNGITKQSYDAETSAAIRKMDAIAIAGLNLASRRESTTPQLADELSILASNVMLSVRHERAAQNLLEQPEPANDFQKEIIRLLEATFTDDPGMKKMADEDRARIFGLQARLMDKMAPKKAQGEIIGAFIGHLALVDGTIKAGSSNKGHNKNKTQSHELNELNPKYTLAQLMAAITKIESGSPADPEAKNWAGCYGIGQWCFWTERAGKYLGNPNAPKTTANQVIMMAMEWNEVLNQLGSGNATAAAWFKGPGFGRSIASLDKNRYQNAIRHADGNGTTILKYLALMEKYAKTVDVHEQLPFLKKVMREHPDAMDWSLLDKEWPIYSYHRLRQVKPFANEIVKKREARIQRFRRQAAERHAQKYNSPAVRAERAKRNHIEGAVNLGMHRVYVKGQRTPTRLYAIEGLYSSSEESNPGSIYYIRGAKNRVIVGARHAKNVVNMVKAAKEDNIKFFANSSLRVNPHQRDLWHSLGRDRNRVAPPGHSGHEDAIHQSAIDFNLGKGFNFNPDDYPARDPSRPAGPDNPRVAPGSKTWRWLNENAHKFGYKMYWNEPWHWSASGR